MNQDAHLALRMNIPTNKISHLLPYIICALAAMFYLYEFVLQVSPAVMTNELMHDLKLNAAGFGAMAAFYYYAYTPMQIPAGLLFDRYGPRVLITIALVICSVGAFFFGFTNNVAWASAGRFFMGIGSAFSFIGSLILIARWFPAKYFALLAGLVQMMSSIGAILGEAPLADVVHRFGWRHTIMYVAMIGIVLAGLVWLLVRDRPVDQQKETTTSTEPQESELSRLKRVCSKSQTWWIALYSFTSWAPITAFAALWGIPFIVALYGVSTTTASTACSMIWIGIGVGSPLIGWWSDRVNRRCMPLTVASIIGVISLTIAIYLRVPLPLMYLLLFFFGVAASGQSLSFGLVKDQSHPNVVGTAIGFNNMAVVAGGALFQPLVGILLDLNWKGEIATGIPIYTAANYRWAFLILPLCYLVGAIVSICFLKETHCHSLHNHSLVDDPDASNNANNQTIIAHAHSHAPMRPTPKSSSLGVASDL